MAVMKDRRSAASWHEAGEPESDSALDAAAPPSWSGAAVVDPGLFVDEEEHAATMRAQNVTTTG